MLATLGPIFALLRGTAFLLAAAGLHGLLLPLRGQLEGFSATSLGLLGTAWAGGFVAGCVYAPRLVRRVGHVRAFGAFAAVGAIVALLTGLIIDPVSWIILRVVTGFTMAGAFMVIESWLNERSTNANRGIAFGLYMMVTYASIMGGQLLLVVGDLSSQSLFMVTGILYCLALIPTTVSVAASPSLPHDVSLDLRGLYENSPVAAIGCVLIGIANGAWGTLGSVYGARAGLSSADVAIMMSLVVATGALAQMPVGRISDHADRRHVLAAAAFIAGAIGFAVFALTPREPFTVILAAGGYGMLAYTLYSIAVAHANDHAPRKDFVAVSSGLLLLYGVGTMIGPFVAGALMERLRPESIFLATAMAHFALAAFAIYRTYVRAPVPSRGPFRQMPAERAVTPEALRLDPRGAEENG